MRCLHKILEYSSAIYERCLRIHFRVIGGPLIHRKLNSKKILTTTRRKGPFQKDVYRDDIRKHKMTPLPPIVEGRVVRKKRAACVLPTPVGYKGCKSALKEQCLFTTLVIARARCNLIFKRVCGRRKKPKALLSIGQYINFPNRQLSFLAGKYIAKEVETLQSKFGDLSTEEKLTSVSEMWQFQLIIYDDEANLVGTYPEVLELSWPFVFLLMTSNESSVGHLELIVNFPAFVQRNGFSCFFPDCDYKSKYFKRKRHICTSSQKGISSCFNCRKMVATGINVRMDCATKKYLFCRNKVEKNIQCKKCNLVLSSRQCFRDHSQICTNLGFMCLKCNKFTHGAQRLVKKAHQCGKEICLKCFQPLTDIGVGGEAMDDSSDPRSEHLCSFSKVKLRKEFPNLAFAQLQTGSAGNANCIICFELQSKPQGGRCCYHENERNDYECMPSVCTLIYEETTHENFRMASFLDPSIGQMEQNFNLPQLPSYIPPEVKQLLPSLELGKKRRRIQFNKIARRNKKFEVALQQLAAKSGPSAMDQFLQYLLQEKFRNFEVLVENMEQLDLITLGLIQNNILPTNVLKWKGKTMRFQVAGLNLTFACSKSYVDQDVWQSLQDGDLLSFFPLSLLQWEKWKETRVIPPLKCFIELEDDSKLRRLKQAYWERQQGETWDPVEQLISSSTSVAVALSKMMLGYLHSCLQYQVKRIYFLTPLPLYWYLLVEQNSKKISLQVSCIDIFGEPQLACDDDLPLLHPLFSASSSGHTYDTFRLFQEGGKLRIIKRAHEFATGTKTSRAEAEFVGFLKKLDNEWITEFGSGYQVSKQHAL